MKHPGKWWVSQFLHHSWQLYRALAGHLHTWQPFCHGDKKTESMNEDTTKKVGLVLAASPAVGLYPTICVRSPIGLYPTICVRSPVGLYLLMSINTHAPTPGPLYDYRWVTCCSIIVHLIPMLLTASVRHCPLSGSWYPVYKDSTLKTWRLC